MDSYEAELVEELITHFVNSFGLWLLWVIILHHVLAYIRSGLSGGLKE